MAATMVEIGSIDAKNVDVQIPMKLMDNGVFIHSNRTRLCHFHYSDEALF